MIRWRWCRQQWILSQIYPSLPCDFLCKLMGELWVKRSSGGAEQRQDSNLTWKSSPPPDPPSLREECLSAAEEAAQQVLNCIYPTLDSEKGRDIIDHVQRLIKSCINCEEFPKPAALLLPSICAI